MAGFRYATVRTWWGATQPMVGSYKKRNAVEKAARWKPWKTKSRFPTATTVPWKSRPHREIPTFPPRLLFPPRLTKQQERILIWAVEKWKSKSRIPTFPPPRKLQAQGRKADRSLTTKSGQLD